MDTLALSFHLDLDLQIFHFHSRPNDFCCRYSQQSVCNANTFTSHPLPANTGVFAGVWAPPEAESQEG